MSSSLQASLILSLVLCEEDQPLQQLIDIGSPGPPRLDFQVTCGRPGQAQYQVIRRQLSMGMTKSLARQAFEKIALNGPARQFLGHNQTDSCTSFRWQARWPSSQVVQIEIIPAQDPTCGKYQ